MMLIGRVLSEVGGEGKKEGGNFRKVAEDPAEKGLDKGDSRA